MSAAADALSRITAYLIGGGLFNPELANHEGVRDLLIDCRDTIEQLRQERAELLVALRDAVRREYNPFEPDNQSERYYRWSALIAKAEGQ